MKPEFHALAVAAPCAQVDPLTPWVEPTSAGDRARAASFWVSFHGLSAGAHALVLFFAFAGVLIPFPLFASMCSTVKLVEKPPERVEVSLVAAPKPPEPIRVADVEPVLGHTGEGVAVRACKHDDACADGERCVQHVCVAARAPDKKKPTKKGHARKHDDDVAMVGLIGLLNSDSNDRVALANVFASADLENALGGVEGGVVGGTIGGLVGGSMDQGVGGLGLVGTGTGDSIGLGTIGTIGHGSGTGSGGGRGSLGRAKGARHDVHLTIDGLDETQRARAVSALKRCELDGDVRGTVVVVVDGDETRIRTRTTPVDPCVSRAMSEALRANPGAARTMPFDVAVAR